VARPAGLPDDDNAALRVLARTICECVKVHFGTEMWALKGVFSSSRHAGAYRISDKIRKQLEAAVRALRAADLAPAVWVLFSLENWQYERPEWSKSLTPPLSWILSPKWIGRHADWATRVARIWDFDSLPNPFSKELWERQQRYIHDYGWQPDMTVGDALAIYEKHFPAKWLERLYADSERYRVEVEISLAMRVSRGEWIWGRRFSPTEDVAPPVRTGRPAWALDGDEEKEAPVAKLPPPPRTPQDAKAARAAQVEADVDAFFALFQDD
jgi:hypothetical protein